MTIQERTKRNKNIKRNRVVKRRIILTIMAMTVIITGGFVFGSIFSAAKNPATDMPQYKYYKSITIEKGDSLWSIAEEYRSDACKNTQSYISELKQLNGLKSDTIHEGQHLIISYYDTQIH